MSAPVSGNRILLVSYHFGRDGATGGFRWSALVDLLLQEGWEFDVICSTGPPPAVAGPISDGADPHTAAGGPLEVFPVTGASVAGAVLGRIEGLPRRLRRAAQPEPVPRGEAGQAVADVVATDSGSVDPDAVTVWHPGHRPALHSRVMREISAGAEALETRAWTREAIRVGEALLARRNYRAILVSSPPHGTQMAGVQLSRMGGGTPLLADLRDPWVLGLERFAGILPAITRRLGRIQERRMIAHADVLIHNTERHRTAVAAEMRPGPRPDQWVVQNGFDCDPGDPDRDRPDAEVFRMVFAGWLHPFMDVRAFFRGAGALVRRNRLSPESCRVEFVGTSEEYGGVSLPALAGAYGLDGFVDMVPRVSRQRALSIQARASVLVAFDCLHPLCIPMKFFDYAPMRGRLLLIGNRDGAMADAAAELDVAVCPVDDEAAVDRVLQGALEDWRSGATPPVNDPARIFHRSVQADVLHRHLRGDLRSKPPLHSGGPGSRKPRPGSR
ncbi:hypothetical protein BH23GEM11_BH23GEM11_16910 [soil metagenome]